MGKKCTFFAISCLVLLLVSTLNPTYTKAEIFTIDITMSGTQEVPPNPSSATGILTGTYDNVTRVLDFDMVFNGLSAPTTAAHFHGPAPEGVNAPVQIGFAGFPTGVTSGSYSNTYVLTPSQDSQIVGGLWYVNIHTSLFPGGEIRGQLVEGTLPVELVSLTSTVDRNNVTINWSTASETNNSGFDIERKSITSDSWSKVGFVKGSGNSLVTKNYSYTERLSSGSYNYRLKQIDYNGEFEYFNLTTEVNVGTPATYSLSQNYPNPFNPTTSINYEIPVDAVVTLAVHDISGKEIATLVNEKQSQGFYTVNVNASGMSSGVYFYTLTARNNVSEFVTTKRMTLIK